MGELVHVSESVQGVELLVRMAGGPVRAVVCRSVLERFGATASPESWVHAYRTHADAIDTAIHRKAALNPQLRRIVLVDTDFAEAEARRPAAKAPAAVASAAPGRRRAG